jgi:glucose-1-phosphate adenylyltransferase
LIQQVIINNLDRLNVKGYQHDGYLSIIHDVRSYFKYSMDLLNPEVWQELFYEPGLIYTKIKDEPPTKYAEHSKVKGSLIANGCEIEGTVENSILFRGVKVAKGAHIKNSIIMQKCEIEAGALLDHVIIDKEVRVTKDKVLSGDREKPVVINKRSWI